VIPAHNAERTIDQVAQALPVSAIDRALLVDDASSDETIQAALASGLEVLPHPTNRGYGANQKTCYVRAALDGADVVVMVHGDNQYDPALVADMTRKIEEGTADVVLGSRLLKDEAIAGGMPRWKWLGNRALTFVENVGFRRHFSEYHTGYRAFGRIRVRPGDLRADRGERSARDRALDPDSLLPGGVVCVVPGERQIRREDAGHPGPVPLGRTASPLAFATSTGGLASTSGGRSRGALADARPPSRSLIRSAGSSTKR
jgi:glycosyltransferase involved in cell wall biosynthesis